MIEAIFALYLALAGLPVADIVPLPPPTECYLLKWEPIITKDGVPVKTRTRLPNRRIVLRLDSRDYDAIFAPTCTHAYLFWFQYEGRRRFSIEARRIVNP